LAWRVLLLLGLVLGPLGALLGACWSLLELLGAISEHLGNSCRMLGESWEPLGAAPANEQTKNIEYLENRSSGAKRSYMADTACSASTRGGRRIDSPQGDYCRPPAFIIRRLWAKPLGCIDLADQGDLKRLGLLFEDS